MPMGSSAGRIETRAMTSATLSNVAPSSALPAMRKRLSGPRTTRRMCGADQAYKTDDASERGRYRGMRYVHCKNYPAQVADVHAERGGFFFADHQRVEWLGG